MNNTDRQIALESAQANIAIAIREMKKAKGRLLAIKNDQHMPLSVALSSLEMVQEILLDPECTPNFVEGDGPEYDLNS